MIGLVGWFVRSSLEPLYRFQDNIRSSGLHRIVFYLYGQQVVDALGKFHLVRGDVLELRNRALVFHKLSFSVQALWKAIPHDLIKVFKDGIDGEGPREPSLNAKNVLERDGFFVRLVHGIGGLLFQSVNGSDARHESVANVHEHAGGEQKGSHTQHGHHSDQMDDDGVECTVLVGTEKVVPSKEGQGVGRTRPSVNQKQQKVLEIVSPDAIVHPRTMVVHAADTPVADPTMVRHGWFEGLALPAHGMGIFH